MIWETLYTGKVVERKKKLKVFNTVLSPILDIFSKYQS